MIRPLFVTIPGAALFDPLLDSADKTVLMAICSQSENGVCTLTPTAMKPMVDRSHSDIEGSILRLVANGWLTVEKTSNPVRNSYRPNLTKSYPPPQPKKRTFDPQNAKPIPDDVVAVFSALVKHGFMDQDSPDWGRPAQRKAAADLVAKHGLPGVLDVIGRHALRRGDKYACKIRSASELKEKWTRICDGLGKSHVAVGE